MRYFYFRIETFVVVLFGYLFSVTRQLDLWNFKGLDTISHLLIPSEDVLVSGSFSGVISCLNTKKNEIIWRYVSKKPSFVLSLEIVDNLVIGILGELSYSLATLKNNEKNKNHCQIFNEYNTNSDQEIISQKTNLNCFDFKSKSLFVFHIDTGDIIWHLQDTLDSLDSLNTIDPENILQDVASVVPKNINQNFITLAIHSNTNVRIVSILRMENGFRMGLYSDVMVESHKIKLFIDDFAIEKVQIHKIIASSPYFLLVCFLQYKDTSSSVWSIVKMNNNGEFIDYTLLDSLSNPSEKDIIHIGFSNYYLIFFHTQSNNAYTLHGYDIKQNITDSKRPSLQSIVLPEIPIEENDVQSILFSFKLNSDTVPEFQGYDIISFLMNASTFILGFHAIQFRSIFGNYDIDLKTNKRVSSDMHDFILNDFQLKINTQNTLLIKSLSAEGIVSHQLSSNTMILTTNAKKNSDQSHSIFISFDDGTLLHIVFNSLEYPPIRWSRNEMMSSLNSIVLYPEYTLKVKNKDNWIWNYVNRYDSVYWVQLKLYLKRIVSLLYIQDIHLFFSRFYSKSPVTLTHTLAISCFHESVVSLSVLDGTIAWKIRSPLADTQLFHPFKLFYFCSYQWNQNRNFYSIPEESELNQTSMNTISQHKDQMYYRYSAPQVVPVYTQHSSVDSLHSDSLLAVIWPYIPFVNWISAETGETKFLPTPISIKFPYIMIYDVGIDTDTSTDTAKNQLLVYNNDTDMQIVPIPPNNTHSKIHTHFYKLDERKVTGYVLDTEEDSHLHKLILSWKFPISLNENILKGIPFTFSTSKYSTIECINGKTIRKAMLNNKILVISQKLNKLKMYIVDSVSGDVLYRTKLSEEYTAPVYVATSDNRFVILCHNKKTLLYQLVHFEVFYLPSKSSIEKVNNKTIWDSLYIINRSYHLNITGILAVEFFKSTSMLFEAPLLLLDNRGRLIALKYKRISARAPNSSTTKVLVEDKQYSEILTCTNDIPSYNPYIHIDSSYLVNQYKMTHSTDFSLLKTQYASSNLTFTYGLDLTVSVYQPELSFDVLTDRMNIYVLLLSLSVVFLSVIISRRKALSSIKENEWK